jgi:hypothetical protein
LMERLSIRSLAGLVHYAIRTGLVDLGDSPSNPAPRHSLFEAA